MSISLKNPYPAPVSKPSGSAETGARAQLDRRFLVRQFERVPHDPTARGLVLANVATIVVALIEGWDLGATLWIYWAQSVIIGIFNVFRILSLRNFTTDGFQMNERPVAPTEKSKRQVAFFFAIHYGFFHVAYLIFLGVMDSQRNSAASEPWDAWPILLCIGVFFINHLYSYRRNRQEDALRKQNLGTVMFQPYARIVPMHLTIILGMPLGNGTVATVFFLLLKTAVDVVMHGAKHELGKSAA
ncbi:MAG: DUF6498-containing protein [Candidatus Eisenbacteria bacterium]